MHYEINVTLNGHHFFATHERSVTDVNKLKVVYGALRNRFKPCDGYEMTVTRWDSVGKDIDMSNWNY